MNEKHIRPASLALRTLAGLALLPLACGGGGGLSPVQGELYVRGQPAAGAVVTFYPLQDSQTSQAGQAGSADPAQKAAEPLRIPTATVGPDGSFRLTTLSAYDGAPPGDYAVSVSWCDAYREDGETRTGPDKLQWRYANAKSSGLKATVKPGSNKLSRFDLN